MKKLILGTVLAAVAGSAAMAETTLESSEERSNITTFETLEECMIEAEDKSSDFVNEQYENDEVENITIELDRADKYWQDFAMYVNTYYKDGTVSNKSFVCNEEEPTSNRL